ncbi:hypothetical protein ACHAWF_010673 [Thalassiosira exigua]
MVLPAINLLAVLALSSAPRHMSPLRDDERHGSASTSDYRARTNHPAAYDDDPPFKGPLRLERTSSPDVHRRRIRGYYLDDERLCGSLRTDGNGLPTLGPSTPTGTIVRSIVDNLARRDAPVDAKEVAESVEFYLRCGKRMFGAARRCLQKHEGEASNTITVVDLCSGHGLAGMMFLACNPPGRIKGASVQTVLVDQFEPKSHSILRECISEVCPWVSEETVKFETQRLDDYASSVASDEKRYSVHESGHATIVISTHACGSLTDAVLRHAAEVDAASMAVMPCCYTGTDGGVPYGVRRMLGVGLSADVQRSFVLQDRGFHVDFAAVPRAITPMNRIIVAERRR